MLETGTGGNVFTLGRNLVLGRYSEVNGVARVHSNLHQGERPEVNGVARVYSNLQKGKRQKRPVNFFYVSNSPTRFYQSIRSGTRNYPKAPLYLNHYHDARFTIEWQEKMERLKNILDDMPKSQFFLFGDNTGDDFWAYIALAQRYPNQINTIYIRLVPRIWFSAATLWRFLRRNRQLDIVTLPYGSEHLVKTIRLVFWANVHDMETDCNAQMDMDHNNTTLGEEYRYLRINSIHSGQTFVIRTRT